MDIITISILVLAILAIGGWGYGSYVVQPAPGAVVQTGGSPGLTLLGIIGLILLVAFVVLLATGWRFGLEIQAPR